MEHVEKKARGQEGILTLFCKNFDLVKLKFNSIEEALNVASSVEVLSTIGKKNSHHYYYNNNLHYYSFKIFLHLWLAKILCIIYHNQVLSTKFALENFYNMWKMMSIVQENYQIIEQLTEKYVLPCF